MKFAADCMLGTLAKWLIILGHDVAFFRSVDDAELVALAVRERRTILTRDRRLVKRRAARDHILIRSQDLRDQIRQVLEARRLAVRPEALFRRCTACNLSTRAVPRSSVRGEVPPYVFRSQRRFKRCPRCRRIYWRATHVERMIGSLRERLPHLDPAAAAPPGPTRSGARRPRRARSRA
ncbi:MAG: Mut7-C RNAse domain-containing protein [Acidobacteriota bacterium]